MAVCKVPESVCRLVGLWDQWNTSNYQQWPYNEACARTKVTSTHQSSFMSRSPLKIASAFPGIREAQRILESVLVNLFLCFTQTNALVPKLLVLGAVAPNELHTFCR